MWTGVDVLQHTLTKNLVPAKVLALEGPPRALSMGVLRLAGGTENTGLIRAPPLHLYLVYLLCPPQPSLIAVLSTVFPTEGQEGNTAKSLQAENVST